MRWTQAVGAVGAAMSVCRLGLGLGFENSPSPVRVSEKGCVQDMVKKKKQRVPASGRQVSQMVFLMTAYGLSANFSNSR